jgi:hypothetical protein
VYNTICGVEKRNYRHDVNTIIHDMLTITHILIDENNEGTHHREVQYLFINLFSVHVCAVRRVVCHLNI